MGESLAVAIIYYAVVGIHYEAKRDLKQTFRSPSLW